MNFSAKLLRPPLLAAFLGILIAGCSKPVPHFSFVSPDGRHWVAMEQAPPAPDKGQLLPTLRLTLKQRWRPGGRLLLEGLEDLCGTTVSWEGDADLLLRLSADRTWAARAFEGQEWGGVRIHVRAHEDQVKMRTWSPDMQRCLLVIQTCETDAWNIYLRRPGEAAYNEAMKRGWDDPDLFGGLDGNQPVLSLKWTGPRQALVKVPGKRYGVTLRDKVGDVSLRWVFASRFKKPPEHFASLKPLKTSGLSKPALTPSEKK